MKTVVVRIFGKVQGVFFRKNTQEKAEKLGINGTVENMPDGSVNVVATGTKKSLEQFLKWCEEGDPPAKVHYIEVDRVDNRNFEGFKILR